MRQGVCGVYVHEPSSGRRVSGRDVGQGGIFDNRAGRLLEWTMGGAQKAAVNVTNHNVVPSLTSNAGGLRLTIPAMCTTN